MKTFKNIALLLAFACAIPVSAGEKALEHATESDIALCGSELGVAKMFDLMLGRPFRSAMGIFVAHSTFKSLAPVDPLLAFCVAAPLGFAIMYALRPIVQIPEKLWIEKYQKQYDKESMEKILQKGESDCERNFTATFKCISFIGVAMAILNAARGGLYIPSYLPL